MALGIFLGAILAASSLFAQLPSRSAQASNPFPFPETFTDESIWENPSFLEAWEPRTSPTKLSHKTFNGKPSIFGHEPHFITGLFIGEKLVSISIVFLDSGTYYGYIPNGAEAPDARSRQNNFDALFETVFKDVADGLGVLSGKRGEKNSLGEEPMLKQEVILFSHGDNVSRLSSVDGQLIKVTLFRSEEEALANLDPAIREADRRELEERTKSRTFVTETGDVMLEDIPLFPQGNRAYCGVSTLAMAMQYMGLNLETEDYAAAAGIRYGSAKGAKVREVYQAAAKEAGLKMYRTTKFDFARARETIDSGIPVVIWRRFSFDRDYLHTQWAKSHAKDSSFLLPKPDLNDQSEWPGKDAPAHASIMNGYNPERREVIFTESWGEYVRNRRMRAEELEGTAYYTFYMRY